MFAFAAWANNLALGLGLETKGTGEGLFWSWADLGIVTATTAEKEWVVAGFEAVLAVTAFGAGGALETSGILFLELVEGYQE